MRIIVRPSFHVSHQRPDGSLHLTPWRRRDAPNQKNCVKNAAGLSDIFPAADNSWSCLSQRFLLSLHSHSGNHNDARARHLPRWSSTRLAASKHARAREHGTSMVKRASSSRVFPSRVFPSMSLSRTSFQKKNCPIQQTLRCFAWSVAGCATPWMRRDVQLWSSIKLTLSTMDV